MAVADMEGSSILTDFFAQIHEMSTFHSKFMR